MTAPALRLHPTDTVAVALRDVAAGEEVAPGMVAAAAVPFGHKLAIAAIAAGEPVVKYGFPIGRATAPIRPGEHVHSHNLATALSEAETYRYHPAPPLPAQIAGAGTFRGFIRPDGRVGTRDELWVLPTVGCVARTAAKIAAAAGRALAGRVGGVHAFAHPHGCSQLGDDLEGTRLAIAGLASHPNARGVLLVGLGCENNQLDGVLAAIAPERRPFVRVVRAQDDGDEVERGVALLAELADAPAERVEVGLDRLVVGLKCGGSDAFSGLTANPLLGRVADRVTGAGGSAILTEIPEIFGAEHILMARAASEAVHDRTAALVNGFKKRFTDAGEPVSENPSPGNIAGGITTLEEKSLGAVQKGGTAPLVDVLDYGGRVRAAGLTLLEAPGNDAVSSTALAVAGATVILFTTGRGTPLGFPAPTIKVASNARLAGAKPGWIDYDAGRVLDAGLDAGEAELLDLIRRVASGEATAAERNEEREIAIWKRGVTL
jgi:altronate hydrolase